MQVLKQQKSGSVFNVPGASTSEKWWGQVKCECWETISATVLLETLVHVVLFRLGGGGKDCGRVGSSLSPSTHCQRLSDGSNFKNGFFTRFGLGMDDGDKRLGVST